VRKQHRVAGAARDLISLVIISIGRRTQLSVVMQSTAGDISYTAQREKCNAESAGITAARRQGRSCDYNEDCRYIKSASSVIYVTLAIIVDVVVKICRGLYGLCNAFLLFRVRPLLTLPSLSLICKLL